MNVTLTFDPATDRTQVSGLIARIFGEDAPATITVTANPTPATVTITPADRPDAGNDDTPTATTSASGAPTVDSTGIRWDNRIHSTPATMTAKGVWRAKRGVDDSLVASVTAELKGGAPVPMAPATIAAPVAPAPLAFVPPPVPAVAAPAVPTAYEEFVNFVAGHINSPANPDGRLTEEWIAAALTHYGVKDGKIQNLQSAPDGEIATIRAGIVAALAS